MYNALMYAQHQPHAYINNTNIHICKALISLRPYTLRTLSSRQGHQDLLLGSYLGSHNAQNSVLAYFGQKIFSYNALYSKSPLPPLGPFGWLSIILRQLLRSVLRSILRRCFNHSYTIQPFPALLQPTYAHYLVATQAIYLGSQLVAPICCLAATSAPTICIYVGVSLYACNVIQLYIYVVAYAFILYVLVLTSVGVIYSMVFIE